MKSAKVLKVLKVTRQTLTKYVKNGEIRVETQPNGMYIYNDDDVYRKAGISAERTNAVYARVSTAKQKKDLDNQVQSIIQYCNNNGIKIDKVFKDVASGMNFDRKQFRDMMNMVLDHKIDTIYITYKDRFSRISFDLFERLFMEYNCKIVVINANNEQGENEEKEIFEEIVSMLHCFSMRMYSRRRKKKLELMEEDLKNDML